MFRIIWGGYISCQIYVKTSVTVSIDTQKMICNRISQSHLLQYNNYHWSLHNGHLLEVFLLWYLVQSNVKYIVIFWSPMRLRFFWGLSHNCLLKNPRHIAWIGTVGVTGRLYLDCFTYNDLLYLSFTWYFNWLWTNKDSRLWVYDTDIPRIFARLRY